MKYFLVVLGILILSTSLKADSNCDQEAIEIVSKISGINAKELSVIGTVKKDLKFFTFIGDTVNESAVYEVKLNADSFCYVEGFYETSLYTDEVTEEDLEKISIFLSAKY